MNSTEQEILNSLKCLKNNKAPGYDGLTTEFYKFFWIDIKNNDSILFSIKTG